MRSLTFLALALAVFTASAWSNSSNSSNSSNFSTTSVTVVFDSSSRNHFANVSAHFNHQDDVIITVSAPNASNHSLPQLNITNFAGNFWVSNASSILSVMNQTYNSTIYRFRFWSVFNVNSPCVVSNGTMSCKFQLYMPQIHEFTDLYFTFDFPYTTTPRITIVGAGYNNRTWDQSVIYTHEVDYTEYLKQHVNLSISHDYLSKDSVRYLNRNATSFNASWMMAELRPMYLGFQCWGEKYFNLIANWTGEDGIYVNTPVNLSRVGLPFDSFYRCNMTVVFTERFNRHALIPIRVQGVVLINGSSSNHSNTTNTTAYGIRFYARGQYTGCNISTEFTRWDGVDLTITPWSYNQSLPLLNLTNYAGNFPVRNVSLLRIVNSTYRSVTYRFNYWYADQYGNCVTFLNYSVGCRFKLTLPDFNVSTDLFVTIRNPFLEQNIRIFGSGFNNRTYDNFWIDTQEVDYTEYLKSFVNLTVQSPDWYNQAPYRLLNWNASSFNASWMMASLKPVALGFQCLDRYYNYSNFVANWTGDDGIYYNTAFNLSRTGLPTNKYLTCNMSVIFTERYNNHALFQINVRNPLYINGTNNTWYQGGTYYNTNSTRGESWWQYFNNASNSTNSTSEFCNSYSNRMDPICLQKKIDQAHFVNKVLIGVIVVLSIGLLILTCKVCNQSKGKTSRDNSPNNSYAELTSRQVHVQTHQPNIVPATPAYLVQGQDGNKFMVIPHKV